MTGDEFFRIKVGDRIKIKPDLCHEEWYGSHMFYTSMYIKGYVRVNHLGRDSVNIDGVSGYGYTKEMILSNFKYGK